MLLSSKRGALSTTIPGPTPYIPVTAAYVYSGAVAVGDYYGFVVTVPEPGTMSLGLVALLCGWFRLHRSSL